MEQEFDVEIKEVLSRVQKVKAESLDDAINKAMDMYYAEQIVLGEMCIRDRRNSCTIDTHYLKQREALNTALPIGVRPVSYTHLLIFSIASVVVGGGIVLLLYKYIGLTGSAYVAIPCVAPIALGGFYSFNGMNF